MATAAGAAAEQRRQHSQAAAAVPQQHSQHRHHQQYPAALPFPRRTCSVTRLMASSELAAVSPTTSHQFSSLRPGKLRGEVG